jgi:hypothetical protein
MSSAIKARVAAVLGELAAKVSAGAEKKEGL